ncbi:hypothetical protein EYF80_001695 [Liparis tanakae]|uniref:Uncharacterized protein n=1 Tax=Liparis tanakae TaxID=230148 RepID=A0A4Z2JE47_9TELE|nr:hypothetical protein EYF80_001695 [Liparis tanakae]
MKEERRELDTDADMFVCSGRLMTRIGSEKTQPRGVEVFRIAEDDCWTLAMEAKIHSNRAHPGVSDGNDGSEVLVPTPVIIYRARVSVGTEL